jgi:hypothetical protein
MYRTCFIYRAFLSAAMQIIFKRFFCTIPNLECFQLLLEVPDLILVVGDLLLELDLLNLLLHLVGQQHRAEPGMDFF